MMLVSESMVTLCFIAGNRYFIIRHGVQGKDSGASCASVTGVAITWLLAIFGAILPLVGVSRYVPHQSTFCLPDWPSKDNAAHGYAIYVVACVTFMASHLIVAYTAIFLYARSTFKKVRLTSSASTNEERKLARRLTLLVLAFMILTGPYKFLILVQLYSGDSVSAGLEGTFISLLSLDSVVNPMLYPLLDGRYRGILQQALPPKVYHCLFWWVREDSEHPCKEGNKSPSTPPRQLSPTNSSPGSTDSEESPRSGQEVPRPGMHLAVEGSLTSMSIPIENNRDESSLVSATTSVLVVHT